jgi:hypothetical protein
MFLRLSFCSDGLSLLLSSLVEEGAFGAKKETRIMSNGISQTYLLVFGLV